MAFSDNFSAGLGHWTIARWRSMTPDQPGDPGHVEAASDNSGDLDGRTGQYPPNDVFIGTGGKLFVGCGSQNYGDTELRCDTKIDISGTRTINLSCLVQPAIHLQGWTYLYVTDKPYTAPSMDSDNSHGPVPRRGFCIRLNGVQQYDGTNFQPAPQVMVYDEWVESGPIEDSSHAPTISPTAMTAIAITFTHSHITITANGSTWFDAAWTLPAALVNGFVYLGAHNHASQKYDPFLQSHNAVFASVAWDGPDFTPQASYRAPDALVSHLTGTSEGPGVDIAYNLPTPTLTIPGVPAGVSAARLLLSAWIDANNNPPPTPVRYVLNGTAAVTVDFDHYSAGNSQMLSAPIDVTKLVTGNNTITVTVPNGLSGYGPSVGNVVLLTETVASGTLKLGSTTLKTLRVGTNKVLKAFLNGLQIWSATPDPTVAGAPTLLTATPGSGQMALTWTAPSSDGGTPISDYLVEYRTSPAGTYTPFSHTASPTPARTVTGLTNGTAYDFRVSTVNAVGTGTPSNVLTATPAVVPTLGNTTEVAGVSDGASQTAVTVPKPSGYTGAAGQQLFLCCFTASLTDGDVPVPPAGFTTIGTARTTTILLGSGVYIYIAWFRSTTNVSAASNYTVTFSSGTIVSRLTCGVINNSSGRVNPTYSEVAGPTTVVLPALTTAAANSLVLAYGIVDTGVTISVPSGYTPATVEGTPLTFCDIWQRLQPAAGAIPTPTITASPSSSAVFASSIAWSP